MFQKAPRAKIVEFTYHDKFRIGRVVKTGKNVNGGHYVQLVDSNGVKTFNMNKVSKLKVY